jgi:hypothetical protein
MKWAGREGVKSESVHVEMVVIRCEEMWREEIKDFSLWIPIIEVVKIRKVPWVAHQQVCRSDELVVGTTVRVMMQCVSSSRARDIVPGPPCIAVGISAQLAH